MSSQCCPAWTNWCLFLRPSPRAEQSGGGWWWWRNYRNTGSNLSLSLSLSLLTLPSLRPSSGKPTDQQVQHNNNTRHSGHGWTRSWSRAYREFSFYQLTSDLPCRRGRGDRTGDQVACSFTLVLLNKSDNSLIMLRPFIIAANWNWNQRNP